MTTETQGTDPALAGTNPPETSSPDGGTSEAGGGESAPPAVEPSAVPEKPDGIQERFNKLTRKIHELEWELGLQRQPQAKPEPVTAPAPERVKTLADFQYDEGQYSTYLFGEAEKRSTAAARRELQAEREQESERRRVMTFKQKEVEFRKATPDYEAVAYFSPISSEVAALVTELDDAPQVAYYLGKNPDVAVMLSGLPERKAAIELGRLQAKISFDRDTLAKSKPVVSQAPAPAPQISAAEGSTTIKPDTPDGEKLSDEAWLKARTKQVNRQRS